jgi:hypothetical protein
MRARWVLAAALVSAGPAAAQTSEPAAPAPLFQAPEREKQWELGVGFLGLVGGSFLSELSDRDKRFPFEVDGQSRGEVVFTYPGFGGVGGGGGLALEANWRGIVGLEVDVLYTRDQGKGDIDGFEITMAQWALHIPLLLKVGLPAGLVRPFLVVGPEFVIPGDPEVSGDLPPLAVPGVGTATASLEGQADPYVAIAFGLGFEFRLPVENADLRIPLTLRGSYNPGVGDKGADRQSLSCSTTGRACTVTLNSEWEWQAAATLGLAYYFHL